MKKLLIGLTGATLVAASLYGSFLWGYYEGMDDHAVISGMSEANWSLAAARSLRQRDSALALELLEANIVWVDTALRLDPTGVPAREKGNYELVLERLDRYRTDFARPDSD